MLKNYFRIAFRSLLRTKLHSTINILGLGLGIACCLLIVLFVRDEWTFDTFHNKADRIYRANVREDWGVNQQFFNTSTPFPLGPVLKENFPEIEREVRILKIHPAVKSGDNQYTEWVTIAGQDFFDVFDFTLKEGSSAGLHQLNGAIINKWVAQKYFGTENPLNKTISIQLGEHFEEFVVRGVTGEIPTNSSIQFGILISDLNFSRMYNQEVLTSAWFDVNPETYVLLRPGADVNQLLLKFPSLFRTLLGDDFIKSNYKVGLQPLTDIHLNTGFPVALAPVSNPKYSYILAAIAGLILFVACINFITLSLGRSIQRAREVGIRKVVGAPRSQLILQFIGEAVIVTLIALVVGVVLALVNLPLFNDLSGKKLLLHFESFTVMTTTCLVVVIGMIAGSYPAFVLSGFSPSSILRGKIPASKQGLRKALVGLQLVLSIFLITTTLLMRRQLSFLQNRDLGFNKEQLAVVPLQLPRVGSMVVRVNKGFAIIEQFKAQLGRIPGIAGVCGASHDFGNGGWTSIGYTDDQGTYRNFALNIVDADYIPTLKMQLSAGRNFSASAPSDLRRSVLVNEAFVKSLGWHDALGKRIPGKSFKDHEIIGVVKDFNFASLYTKVEPVVIAMDATIPLSGAQNINIDEAPIPKLIIRLQPGDMKRSLDQVAETWQRLMGNSEFSFAFVDQTMALQYQNDQNLGKIMLMATVLAIFIGSCGLYGLASLILQNRTKEISIRKVMGASGKSIMILLSGDYMIMILISLILSVPVTLYVIYNWLQTFEYRIAIGWDTFLLAGTISLMIVLVTISYQVLKTASAQPAETLKYE